MSDLVFVQTEECHKLVSRKYQIVIFMRNYEQETRRAKDAVGKTADRGPQSTEI